jgi:hypothetical protein
MPFWCGIVGPCNHGSMSILKAGYTMDPGAGDNHHVTGLLHLFTMNTGENWVKQKRVAINL